MHISEGVLSAPVLATGAVLSLAGVAIGLKKMDYEKLPEVGVLSSVFFVASLIHVPIGPAAAHLVLNGICGLILGWMAFPAILVGLVLQGILFQFGGLTTLGINTFNMAFPAVLVGVSMRSIDPESERCDQGCGRVHSGRRRHTRFGNIGSHIPRGYRGIVLCGSQAYRRRSYPHHGRGRNNHRLRHRIREACKTGDAVTIHRIGCKLTA